MVLAKVMKEGSWLIKGLTFDSAHSHRYVKEALMGSFTSLKQEDLTELDWWCELTYEDLPPHAMPRLPLRKCLHQGETVICLPGVCFLAEVGRLQR